MISWIVTCVNVGGYKRLKENAKSIFRIKVKGKDVVTLYGHVTLQVLNEIHGWTLKSGTARFLETKIKKIKLQTV